MNRVVHCKKGKFDVYVGRPTKWGNPFTIGKDGSREEVIQKYREWIVKQPGLVKLLHELTGKTLGCWCAPLPCHGDVLAELANKENQIMDECKNRALGSLEWDKKEVGLYHKYVVMRTDGAHWMGSKHYGCDYFVLDMTHDPFALPAISAYANACKNELPLLAQDLNNKYPVQARQPEIDALNSETEEFRGDCLLITAENEKLRKAAQRVVDSWNKGEIYGGNDKISNLRAAMTAPDTKGDKPC